MNSLANQPISKSKLRLCTLFIFIFAVFLFLPGTSSSQKKDIIPIVECVQDLGNGTYIANFGYDNPNREDISVSDSSSFLIFNRDNTKEKSIRHFKSGRQYKVFSKTVNINDKCTWSVILPNGKVSSATSSINSSHQCPASENISAYYPAPEGGKLNNSLIGPALTALYELHTSGVEVKSDDIFQIFEEDKVLIEIFVKDGKYPELLNLLLSENYGLTAHTKSNADLSLITGLYPISNLLKLNKLPKLIVSARPVYAAKTNAGTVLSQGDISMRSDFVKGGYNVYGEGIKVGVLSNSYNTQGGAPDDIANLELPNTVTVLEEYLGLASDEGRAMLQIVHDIAPKAQLYFRTGINGPVDFAQGIKELANAGCDVIVDDITYITEPFFHDGIVARTVNDVVNTNQVAYFTSAGNFGHASYLANEFIAAQTPRAVSGIAHDFGGGDIYQSITLQKGTYTIVLQWDEGETATTDLDIYLTEEDGTNLLGYNRNSLGSAPIEVLPFTVSEGGATTNIMITKASGDAMPRFKYIVFRGNTGFTINEYGTEGASTIVGHANASGAMTVGAVRFDKTPAFNKSIEIMSYSSIGGTPINGESLLRQKPDFTAPNGVNTTVDLGNGDWDDEVANQPGIDPDSHPNFFGTSAAAPHAAAVAALLIDANKKYNLETIAPLDLRSKLSETAIKNPNEPDVDFKRGSGFIQADKALATIALPAPAISGIFPPETIVMGSDVTFLVKGEYFDSSSKIFCRGLEIPTTFISNNELEGTIINFEGNPLIHVETPSISLSASDGGATEKILFSQEPKMDVTVLINNETRLFGQINPVFSSSFLVTKPTMIINGTDTSFIDKVVPDPPLLDTHMPGLEFLAPSSLSNIGIWGINAVSSDTLPQAIKELYNFKYEDLPDPISGKFLFKRVNNQGLLTINKMPVSIQAEELTGDKALIYGEEISGNDLNFIYDFGGNTFHEDLPGMLNALHRIPAKENGLALLKGITLQNGLPTIDGSPLQNGIPLIEGLALVNGWEITIDANGITMTKGEIVNTIPRTSINNDGYTFLNELSFYLGNPLINATDIVQGLAIVNQMEIVITYNENTDLSRITEINGKPYPDGLAIVDGVPLIEGLAIVNGQTIEIINGEIFIDGLAIVNGEDTDEFGNGMINGIPVIGGLAIVNTKQIISGLAMVNCIQNEAPLALGLAIVNGKPVAADGLAIVNGRPTNAEGLAIVNGVPVIDGLAIINGVPVVDGLAIINGVGLALVNGKSIPTDGLAIVNGTQVNDGLAIVNGTPVTTGLAIINGYDVAGLAIVNGSAFTDGLALVNSDGIVTNGTSDISGLALVNAIGHTEFVSMDNLGLLASESALTNGIGNQFLLTNSPSSFDGLAIVDAVNHNSTSEYGTADGLAIVNTRPDEYGLAIVNKVPLESGLALVNAQALVEGLAIVNGTPVIEGLALVNGVRSTDGLAIINGAEGDTVQGVPDAHPGVLMLMDLSALAPNQGDPAVNFVPVSLISGTTAGEHWIIPAALNSNNFEASYLPSKVEIKKAILDLSISGLNFTYDGKPKKASVTALNGPDLNITLTYLQGEDTILHPTQAGIYQVLANVADDNYTGSAINSLVISKALATVQISSYENTYDGNSHGISGIVTGVNDEILNGFDPGARFTDVPGGMASWTFTDETGNYLDESGTSPVVITKANAIIVVEPYKGFYDGDPHNATGNARGVKGEELAGLDFGTPFTNVPGGTANWTFTDISGNYLDTSGIASVEISKTNPQIVVNDYTGYYDGYPHNASGIALGVKGDELAGLDFGAPIIDVPGGTVNWTFADISGNYNNTSGTANVLINKASLWIKADRQVINQGDQPVLSATVTGLAENDDMSTINLSLSLDKPYEGLPGIYKIIPSASGQNYFVEALIADSLFVNPWGPGTKKIRSSLHCISENGDGTSTARFGYVNNNAVPVFVALGANNYFEPEDSILEGSVLPELFLPGSGEFYITYYGTDLTWTIRSYESNHYTSTTSGANLSSPKCTKSGEIVRDMYDPEKEPKEFKVYPNPTNGRITINFTEKPEESNIHVFDLLGRKHQVEQKWIPASGLEIDLSPMVPGVYLIKVNNSDNFITFRIIKK